MIVFLSVSSKSKSRASSMNSGAAPMRAEEIPSCRQSSSATSNCWDQSSMQSKSSTKQISLSQGDPVIAAAPRRCPAYGVDAVLGPVLDDTAGAADLSPPGPWRYWMMGRPVSASMTMVLT